MEISVASLGAAVVLALAYAGGAWLGEEGAAGVWTRDVQRAHRMARALRAGTVWINAYRAVAPMAPFGVLSGTPSQIGESVPTDSTSPASISFFASSSVNSIDRP